MKGARHKGHTFYDSIYIKYPEQANLQRQRVAQWFPKAREEGQWGLTTNGYRVSFCGDENVLVTAEHLCLMIFKPLYYGL